MVPGAGDGVARHAMIQAWSRARLRPRRLARRARLPGEPRHRRAAGHAPGAVVRRRHRGEDAPGPVRPPPWAPRSRTACLRQAVPSRYRPPAVHCCIHFCGNLMLVMCESIASRYRGDTRLAPLLVALGACRRAARSRRTAASPSCCGGPACTPKALRRAGAPQVLGARRGAGRRLAAGRGPGGRARLAGRPAQPRRTRAAAHAAAGGRQVGPLVPALGHAGHADRAPDGLHRRAAARTRDWFQMRLRCCTGRPLGHPALALLRCAARRGGVGPGPAVHAALLRYLHHQEPGLPSLVQGALHACESMFPAPLTVVESGVTDRARLEVKLGKRS